MSAEKWLTALQKSVHPGPHATQQPKPAGDPLCTVLLDKAFATDGDVMVAEKRLSPYDEPADATGLDPFGDLIRKTQNSRFEIPEIAVPVEHPDGVEMERSGDIIFKFHWQGGNLVKTETFHPDTGWESVEEPEAPMYVETSLAKLAGLRPEDQHVEEI